MTGSRTLTRPQRVGAVLAVLVLLTIVSWRANPSFSFKLALGTSYAVVILGIVILTGFAGQISLAQAEMMAAGAYATAHLAPYLPLPLVILLSGAAAVPLGLLIGLPALRLRGIALAIATLSFALVADTVLPAAHFISGGQDGINTLRPGFGPLAFTDDRMMFGLAATCFVVLALFVNNVRRGKSGRAFAAIRDSEVAAAASGLSIMRYKLQAFAIAAFCAGVGGSLYAYTVGTPNPGDLTWYTSVQLVLLAIVSGLAFISGAALAGFLNWVAFPTWLLPLLDSLRETLLPFFKHQGEQMLPLLFGILLLVQLNFAPEGVAGQLNRDLGRLIRRLRNDRDPVTPALTVAGGKS